LVGELVFQLFGLARGLVFEAHRLLDRRDLSVGKFARPLTHDRGQRATWYEQVHEIAFKGIGGPAHRGSGGAPVA
jgi:hypothetical protein